MYIVTEFTGSSHNDDHGTSWQTRVPNKAILNQGKKYIVAIVLYSHRPTWNWHLQKHSHVVMQEL